MIIKIILICIVSAVLIQFFKSFLPQIVPFIAISSGIIIFSLLYGYINTTFLFLENIEKNITGFNDSIKISIKTIGISIICEFASQLCTDMGEGYMSSKIDFAGKIMIFCLVIPELIEILDIVTEMINVI